MVDIGALTACLQAGGRKGPGFTRGTKADGGGCAAREGSRVTRMAPGAREGTRLGAEAFTGVTGTAGAGGREGLTVGIGGDTGTKDQGKVGRSQCCPLAKRGDQGRDQGPLNTLLGTAVRVHSSETGCRPAVPLRPFPSSQLSVRPAASL